MESFRPSKAGPWVSAAASKLLDDYMSDLSIEERTALDADLASRQLDELEEPYKVATQLVEKHSTRLLKWRASVLVDII